jgi:hypothetical protein
MSAPPDSDHHPSSLRNRDPILEQLQLLLPPASGLTGLALEVASGTGAHLEFFAPAFPSLTFQPSEYVPDEAAPEDEQWSRHGKIGNRAGRDELACLDSHGCKRFTNVLPAVPLDLSVPWAAWPKAVTENEGRFVLMLCSNTLHISPWECTLGFMSGGGKALATGGHLFIYGPFKVGGQLNPRLPSSPYAPCPSHRMTIFGHFRKLQRGLPPRFSYCSQDSPFCPLPTSVPFSL